MKVLFDIGHPAHVHFFRHPIRELKERGHELVVTSRHKEMAVDLLDELAIQHVSLSAHRGGGLSSLGKELITRNYRLYGVVRRTRPDVMAAIGGIFIAQVGRLTGVPSAVFYDTENARLQNALTYPFASLVIVPRCYQAWTPRMRTVRYPGYHELSYLRPGRFTPSRNRALAAGLDPERDTFFVRLVSWQANHDLREHGWSVSQLKAVVERLTGVGKVIISSEAPLPACFVECAYRGSPDSVHHLMAFCRGFIGESATMASECAVMGVPAVYAALTGRGYTDEQETRYGLVRNVRQFDVSSFHAAIDWMLDIDHEQRRLARENMLADTIDVCEFVVESIERLGTRRSHS